MGITFGVLGPVAAWDSAGDPIPLKGPRHRAVLARLIAARGRVVPVGDLVTDLWVAPPEGAIPAVRTFVAALRRALEPDRTPRVAARLLVTEGPGYALRAAPAAVDAWRFEDTVRSAPGDDPVKRLVEALSWWRGPAYADFADEPWTGAERSRLAELRLRAVEQLAEARLAAGDPAGAIPDLDAHATEHPWREQAWRLLALALYRTGRQPDALAVLRRARTLLSDQLGLDPTPELRKLESDILRQAPQLDLGRAGEVWADAAADYDRIVAAGARARLDSTVTLLRSLAVTSGGGLEAARRHRTAAIAAAEELGDPALTARVIGAYDVPAIWPRPDDPAQAAAIVAAAHRALRQVEAPATRARLLATIAVESRGAAATAESRAGAVEAVGIAREQDDPALLAFALNGLFMQSTYRIGLAAERDRIGAELVEVTRRAGLVTSEVLGHLIRIQARSALADFAAADRHAAAADELSARHELPLVTVFTTWYRAMRLSVDDPEAAGPAYAAAALLLDESGMPGLAVGLPALARLALSVRCGEPSLPPATGGDFGPFEKWALPHVHLAEGREREALAALGDLPAPAPDLLSEALWGLTAQAAHRLGDQATLDRARSASEPARDEIAAGSGLIFVPQPPV
ncbi:DNA-binding SARP family transcriptional activator [Actinoplanes tereljensis]|uniref:SARP family transcriptional regulator n=1 Tax=Paractinoplanes tereljensis TaxID=571912 RepID=A0A919TU78_9ACTN|nr:BTAD domain-containing putative transcriptional regulator [Actinoplanes tereljensis]GIF22039.1 SARP family transcriptional regulator [Actinoplanes tereljensis]